MQGDVNLAVREEVRVKAGGESVRDCRLQLEGAPVFGEGTRLATIKDDIEQTMKKNRQNSLVTSPMPLAIHRAEPCDDNAHNHLCPCTASAGTATSSSSTPRAAARTRLARPRNDAHNLCVAHFKVAGAISSGLGPDLGVDAP
jgi:hypothetical protein